MRVDAAVDVVRQMVRTRWSHRPGFVGAFLAGSVTDLSSDDEVPPTSDVDVTVVLGPEVHERRVKERVGPVLLETTVVPVDQLADPALVATNHFLASSFRGGQLIADPQGRLVALERRVAPTFAAPTAVMQRVDHVLGWWRVGWWCRIQTSRGTRRCSAGSSRPA